MQEVRHDGIRVAYVAPGSVDTSFGGGAPRQEPAGRCSPTTWRRSSCDLLAHPGAQPSEPRRDSPVAAAAKGLTDAVSRRFDKHREQLEVHETMMGASRGRLAVALDLLTDALAMVGQHGVYCQSARMPGRPTLDIALVIEQIGDAKELLQTVIEAERAMSDAVPAPSASSRTTTCSSGSSRRARASCIARATRGSDARSRSGCCPPTSRPDADSRAALVAQARAMTVLSHPNVTTLFDAGEHEGRVYPGLRVPARASRCARDGRPPAERAARGRDRDPDRRRHRRRARRRLRARRPEPGVGGDDGSAVTPRFRRSSWRRTAASTAADGEVRLHDYDSPEEARGQPADDRSDIYSVGAILYEMLTAGGRTRKGAAAPSASNRHVPPELDDVVLRAVAPNPDIAAAVGWRRLRRELRGVVAHLDAQGGAGDEGDEPRRAGHEHRARAAVCGRRAGAGRWPRGGVGVAQARLDGCGLQASRASGWTPSRSANAERAST